MFSTSIGSLYPASLYKMFNLEKERNSLEEKLFSQYQDYASIKKNLFNKCVEIEEIEDETKRLEINILTYRVS